MCEQEEEQIAALRLEIDAWKALATAQREKIEVLTALVAHWGDMAKRNLNKHIDAAS